MFILGSYGPEIVETDSEHDLRCQGCSTAVLNAYADLKVTGSRQATSCLVSDSDSHSATVARAKHAATIPILGGERATHYSYENSNPRRACPDR